MISVNELRKGNFVFVNNPKSWDELQNIPMQVTGLGYNPTPLDGIKDTVTVKKAIATKYDIYYDYNQFANFIEPIELNYEWLSTLGCTIEFSSAYADVFEIITDFETSAFFWIKVLKTKNEIRVTHSNAFLRTVKYVHEFQNLIFAISGIELQIKQP